MQRVDCDVHLGDDRNHVVRRCGITVAEVEVLRYLHGEGAVCNIQPVRMTRDQDAHVLDELKRRYRARFPGPAAVGAVNVVDVVYPPPRPKLPVNLKDIGVTHPQAVKTSDSSDTKRSDTKRSGAKSSRAKAPPAADVDTDAGADTDTDDAAAI